MLDKIAKYASFALTTEVGAAQSDQNDAYHKINGVADFCLTPLRYFVGNDPGVRLHYSYENPKEIVYASEMRQPTKCWQVTLLMIAAFIPGIIVGVIGKAVALTSSAVREDIAYAQVYLVQCREVALSNSILAPKYRDLRQNVLTFHDYLLENREKGRAIWKEQATIDMVDPLMKKAADFMDLLFSELARSAKNNPKRMAEILSYQPQSHNSIFCYCFFNNSLWTLYDTVRNHSYYEKEKRENEPNFRLMCGDLTKEDEDPFFTHGTVQASWRDLYNQKVAKLDLPRPIGAQAEVQTMRSYFMEGDTLYDSRCNVAIDEKPVPDDRKYFVPLPGYPTMRTPAILRG